ncbi:universal stress protein [bacterium]|nr:universal stress protein [bacterium]
MKILIPRNGSLQSETVLPYVQCLAEFWKAELVLLRVLDPMSAAGDPLAARLLDRPHETKESAERYLEEIAMSLEGIRTSRLCLTGSAAEEVCRQASQLDCSLIVFSPHGHGGVERWLFGSVA